MADDQLVNDNMRFGRVAAWRGALALLLVAVVALGGGLLLLAEARHQAALARDVNEAGRQRMLTQRIAVAAALGDLDRIEASAQWLEEVHDHLMHDATVPFTQVMSSDAHLELMTYIQTARSAAAGDAEALRVLPPTAEALLVEIDAAVTAYEQLAVERTVRLQIGVVLGALTTMLAAGVAWFGVARPGLQALRSSADRTQRSAELVHERSERLARQVTYREALTEMAMQALASEDLDALLSSGAELVRESLEADWCHVLEVTSTRRLRVRAGEPCGCEQRPRHLHEVPGANYALVSRTPLLVPDLATEQRFQAPEWMVEHGMRGCMAAMIPGRKAPFGILIVHSRDADRFTRDDLDFLVTAAMVLGSLVERMLAQRAASEQEEQYLRLAEHANDLIFRYQVAPVRRCLYVNEAAERLLGHPPEEWRLDPDLLDRLREAAGDASDDLWQVEGEKRRVVSIAHPTGGVRRLELELTSVPVQDPDGDQEGVVVEGIGRDVTEREEVMQVLEQALSRERRASEELREIAGMKDAFLAAVSHELRTPLTVISGVAETLGEHATEIQPHQQAELLRRLQANAEKLDRLLADLLDLERLTHQRVDPVPAVVDVTEVVAASLEEIDLEGRRLITDLAAVEARVDVAMLERIVVNLVGNAVKHTPVGTRIWVTLSRSADALRLVVADEGPGVPPELHEAVFEPFERGPGAPAHAPGYGIGLTLVRRFAELQDGRAWLEGRSGGGAAFHVELPIE